MKLVTYLNAKKRTELFNCSRPFPRLPYHVVTLGLRAVWVLRGLILVMLAVRKIACALIMRSTVDLCLQSDTGHL